MKETMLKIYKQIDNGAIVPAKLRDVIAEALRENTSTAHESIEVLTEGFSDKSSCWIEIKETREKKVVSLVLMFDYDGDKMTDINLFETPIVKLVDSDKTKQIV